jgi:hypothetical protein
MEFCISMERQEMLDACDLWLGHRKYVTLIRALVIYNGKPI